MKKKWEVVRMEERKKEDGGGGNGLGLQWKGAQTWSLQIFR